MKKIHKLLVANRGEIALRIMRTAREMGIKTVAVYSDADKQALHVRYADEAVALGGNTSAESYLKMDKIIAACIATGANAIHPGYGFLSENPKFAKRVEDSNLIFVGPSSHTIEKMGSKIEAKRLAAEHHVPLVPGTREPIQDLEEAKKIALEIGYPILVKASAGGGGKGMRVVHEESEFDEQVQRAISEATSSFGDGSVFIEKYITSPKHIEVQVLGDQHGEVIHLFDRECSIQRRHQKVIEEAPSPTLNESAREEICKAAVRIAKASGYYSAGTVEFVVDENHQFYFLEINTRLQVEHPVTELVCGVDLVKAQILIAEGQPLPYQQSDIKRHGHAIEARVYAEDPENQFLPDAGKLESYKPPKGVGLRIDDGYEEGMDIPIYYDPMIAKLIAYAPDRSHAIERMIRAIQEYEIIGVKTTLPFCEFAINHAAFRDVSFTTKFVEQYFKPEVLHTPFDHDSLQAAMVAAIQFFEESDGKPKVEKVIKKHSLSKNWRNRINR